MIETVCFKHLAPGEVFTVKGNTRSFRNIDGSFACPADVKDPMLTDYYPFKSGETVQVERNRIENMTSDELLAELTPERSRTDAS